MVGKTILHYKIIKQIGEGGMGVVYKAEDTKLKREVALKFLPLDAMTGEEEKARFGHEAQAAAALDHPNICTIHEINEADGQKFIAMAYVKGKTLQDVVKQGPLPLGHVLDYGTQIAEGLQAANEKDIVHRDIKPANILITEKGQIKITDFGLAKLAGRTQLTKEGTSMGTVAYMSPEQTQGTNVDHRTDVWALGVVIYEMLTGKQPFIGDYEQAVMYSIMHEEPEPVTGLRTGIPMELERIVNKCLEKEPQNRYQAINETIVDLRRVNEVTAPTKMPIRKVDATRKHRRLFMWSGILLAGILLAISVFLFFGRQGERRERLPIAVVDFVNETDEKELDGLSGLLITALEQSPRLSVLTRMRMFDILKKLGKEDVERIDESLGREICTETNVSAMVTASVRKLGNRYAIDLKVLDLHEEEYLFTAKEENEGQEKIFTMIDNLSEKTRRGLKEIEFQAEKVAQITTANFEAWQLYFEAEKLFSQEKVSEAQDKLKNAIALDSTFGLAYYRLAVYSGWDGAYTVDVQALDEKAVALIDRIPEKERYLVRANHAVSMEQLKGWEREEVYTTALENGIDILKEMEKIYPTDKEMLFLIGDNLFHLARYDEALVYFEKVYAMDPDHQSLIRHLVSLHLLTQNYDKMFDYAKQYFTNILSPGSSLEFVRACIYADKYEEGLTTLAHYRELYPDKYFLAQAMQMLHILKGKYKQAEVEIKKAYNDFDLPIRTQVSVILALYQGRYKNALNLTEERLEYFRKDTTKTMSLIWEHLRRAEILVWCDSVSAQSEMTMAASFKEKFTDGMRVMLGRVQVLAGNYQEAEHLINELPLSLRLGHRNAGLAYRSVLQSKNQACFEASRLIEKVSFDYFPPALKALVFYHLAECQFKQGFFDMSIDLLSKAQRLKYSHMIYALLHPRILYLLAKIYENKGDSALAVENYEKFLDVWKNADEDLPDLIDAKKRLAKLKEMSNKGS